MYDFNSNEYKKKLKETDNYIGTITESIFEKYENPLILLTTDHGGIDNRHGGNSEDEINTFIASNVNLDSLNIEDINYNMNCSKIILKALNINIPSYFD